MCARSTLDWSQSKNISCLTYATLLFMLELCLALVASVTILLS